jgi:apolipoprotein N-acyltransferase
LWAAAVWTADEALRSRVPFGGFPWAKVAFSQPDGVFASVASWGGTALEGFVVALCGFSLAALLISARSKSWFFDVRWPAVGVIGSVVVGAVAWLGVGTDANAGMVTVAAIQGNVPRAGLDFNSQRRAVLDNHVKETLRLAADVRAGRVKQPDLVIWPENSSDIDPFLNPDAYAEIDEAVQAINAPVAVGAVVWPTVNGVVATQPRNEMVLWVPGAGPVDSYTKRQLQPFGETMPFRSLLSHVSSYVDKAGNFQAGTRVNAFAMGQRPGAVATVALNTCYEVAFDSVVRDSVTETGANLLAVPTNNATFGHSDMTYQQLAMDRTRAIEHGRSVVVAATSGVSGLIEPDGSVIARSGLFVPAELVASIPLRSTVTLADRLGAAPEWALVVLAAVGVALGVGTRRQAAARARGALAYRSNG